VTTSRVSVLLDANVLIDAQVRDLFFRLSEAGHIKLRWTDGILGEVQHTLTQKLGRPPESVERLCDAIRRHFPHGRIATFIPLDAPDPGDSHVLGAAVAGECDLIVTHDRRGFPADEALAQWDLEVLGPDEALTLLMGDLGVGVVADAFKSMTETLSRPPLKLSDQLDRLADMRRGRCPFTALVLRTEYGDENSRGVLSDYRDALSEESPVTAVLALLRGVKRNDPRQVDDLLHSDGRFRFGATPHARLARVGQLLAGAERWSVLPKSWPSSLDRVDVLLTPNPSSTSQAVNSADLLPVTVTLTSAGWRIEDIGGA
jgi:predicted nucleic acid-binding protein